jgi:hypothetical protein
MELYIRKLPINNRANHDLKISSNLDLFRGDDSLSNNENFDRKEDLLDALLETTSIHFLRLYPK